MSSTELQQPTSSQQSAVVPETSLQRMRRWFVENNSSLIVAVVLLECLIFASMSPAFLTVDNFLNIALQISIYGILAVGMTLVIITGGIDLSVGSVVAFGGILAAMTAQSLTHSPWLGLVVGAVVGTAAGGIGGLFAGFMVTRFRVPPFIVTLALMTIARGLAFTISEGVAIGNLPAEFQFLGRQQVGPIPLLVLIMAVVFLAGYLFLSRTKYGRYVLAIGGNEEASRLSGIRTHRILMAVYLINGLLAGFAGVALASRLGAGVPNAGSQYELDVIAAVVIGGTSLMGGVGSIIGTLWGTIFIGVLNNGLNLANVDPYTQKVALGAVILLAVLLDQWKKQGR
jgi:ribose transport system permease protein